jgi:hypothetical protein
MPRFSGLPRRLALAAIQHVVGEVVTIVVLGAPHDREQTLLIRAPARDSATTRGRLTGGASPVRQVAFEPGDFRIDREGPLEDRARRVNGDRRDPRTEITR